MKIPNQHIASLAKIANSSEKEIDQLLKSFSATDLTSDIEGYASRVAERLSLPTYEATSLLRALTSLSATRTDFGESIPDFVDELLRSMSESTDKRLHLSVKDQEAFKEKIGRLLSYEPLSVAAKAAYLKNDYEHSYCRARIFTDIRPVFSEDRSEPPVAAVITHVLKLVYHERGATKEIHIAMDATNIAALKILLDRAETKAKSLKPLLEPKLTVIAE